MIIGWPSHDLGDSIDRRMKMAPWFFVISVAGLLRIGLALHPGLWSDEIFSLAMATGHSLEHPADEANQALGDYVEPLDPQPPSTFRRYMQHEESPAGPRRVMRAVLLSDTSPPLYYLILNLWSRVAGTGDAGLRLFSTVWAMACFPLLWLIGFNLGNTRTAWAGCLLFAFSPLALYYSTEGRMYSLVWFLALFLVLSTLMLRRDGPRSPWLILWILSAAAGLLTHYFFAFVLAACMFWLFLYPGKVSRRRLAALVVTAELIVLPWYVHIPESISRWRVTQYWLHHPLTWDRLIINPLKMGGSYLSVSGIWGTSNRFDILAAAVYVLFFVLVLQRGIGRLFAERQRLIWLWVVAAIAGPAVFDLMGGTNASSIMRYALPGLPAAILLVAVAVSNLSPTTYTAFLVLVALIWFPAVHKIFAEPSRYWEPFPDVGVQLDSWAKPHDLIIAHTIPSGVLGLSRYIKTDTPIASWVVQLKQRKVPDDIQRISSSYNRVALVKIHDLNEPSPAEAWLLQNESLQNRETLNQSRSEILYFLKEPN
jgi:hypothetical protein